MLTRLPDDTYTLTLPEDRWAELRDAGWIFSRIARHYQTSDWRKAAVYMDLADTDATYFHLEDLLTDLEAAIDASFALDADVEIARPHIVNRKGEVLDYLGYQKAGILYAADREDTMIGDQPGLGKGQPLWAKVLTPTGWRLMGDLVEGGPIIGADGKIHYVTGIFDKGVLPIYRVEFNDGAVTHVDSDHLWLLRRKFELRKDKSRYQPDWEVMETRSLISRAFSGGIKDNKIEIPLVKPVEYGATSILPLDPYVIGALLGDGSMKYHVAYFSNISQGVLYQVITRLPQGYVLRHSDRCSYRIGREEGGPCSQTNAVTGALRDLNLMGTGSADKFIPEVYLHSSPSDRLLVLQGLMDTDGYIAMDGTVQFSSNSPLLRDGVVELVQSLGGVARRSQKISASGKDHFITTINLAVCPFLGAKEKIARWRPREKYTPKRIFRSIELVGKEPVRCISVSAPDKLYITDDFIVTHNTIQAIGLINHLGITSGVIVCPSTLKLNWLKEMTKWLLDKSLTIGVAAGSEIPDTDFIIINYDILARNRDKLWAEDWGILVCDEAQYLSNADSNRTQAIFGTYAWDFHKKKTARKPVNIKRRWSQRIERVYCLPANLRVMLTGTPIMKEPKGMWPIIRDFDPDDMGKSFENFALDYCNGQHGPFGLVCDGGSNLGEFNEKIRRKFMIRRLKSQVLTDLPPKTREIIILPAEGLKRMIKTERDKFTDALAMLGAANDSGEKITKKTRIEDLDPAFVLDTMAKFLPAGFDAPEIADLDAGDIQPGFAAYSEARAELALSKVPMVVEHLKRLLAAGEKVIVFAIHRAVIAELYTAFPQAARIIGGMSAKKVEAEKLRFQGDADAGIDPDPDCNIILLNMKAGGVGHTLTEATVEVFLEMWSVPGDMEQCEDRGHRIGLAHNLLIQFIVIDGTIDAITIQTLIDRIEVIEEAIDGREKLYG